MKKTPFYYLIFSIILIPYFLNGSSEPCKVDFLRTPNYEQNFVVGPKNISRLVFEKNGTIHFTLFQDGMEGKEFKCSKDKKNHWFYISPCQKDDLTCLDAVKRMGSLLLSGKLAGKKIIVEGFIPKDFFGVYNASNINKYKLAEELTQNLSTNKAADVIKELDLTGNQSIQTVKERLDSNRKSINLCDCRKISILDN